MVNKDSPNVRKYMHSATQTDSCMWLTGSHTFCHENLHEVRFAVNVTFHASEVSHATEDNTYTSQQNFVAIIHR